MFESPDLIRLADRLAAYAGARTGLIAKNVANADTPGYHSRTLPDFAELVAAAPVPMRATRTGHVTDSLPGRDALRATTATGEASMNGNTVSLEREMVAAVAARQQHEMALAIRSATANVIRAALGRSS